MHSGRKTKPVDFDRIYRCIAHTIKGGALNIGADELSSAALEMERKALDGNLAAARCGMHRVRRAAYEVNRYILRRYKE